MPRFVRLESLLRRPAAPPPRTPGEMAPAASELARIDRLALVACVAGGGSGALVILTQLFCLYAST